MRNDYIESSHTHDNYKFIIYRSEAMFPPVLIICFYIFLFFAKNINYFIILKPFLLKNTKHKTIY
jgi:hypothetical protein